ncbi:Tetratricopeptide repeat-containing protein [Zhouia amylolytica]|uniref:Tetratricopeptide repeat-containing protein n=1 Tax=Zhouia amylolytica TaxID=376730 RepID=A0A1I6QLR2_9FLAO|nr:tetratricopeptide repeat protein [Zhouia amylolytica]SFS53417.1 Tetratricopeptide repeat-containing protein [Zhouia amylolytica]
MNRLYSLTYSVITFVVVVMFLSCKNDVEIRTSIENELAKIDSASYVDPQYTIFRIDSLITNTSNINDAEMAMAWFYKGEDYYLNDQFFDAIQVHKKTYDLFNKLGDPYNKGRCLITLSAAHIHLKDYEIAQEYALEALHIAQLIQNHRIEAKAYNQLFHLHFLLKDYKKALTYIHKSDSLFKDSKDTTSIIAIKSNIASAHLQLKSYNKALKNYSEALTLSQHSNDTPTLVRLLNNIGYAYIEAQDYDSAEKFLRGAITVNKNINAINAAPFKGLGNLFLIRNQTDSAKINYQKALKIFDLKKNHKEIIAVSDKLISISIMLGDYHEALEEQMRRDSIQKLVNNIEKDQLLSFANVKYEVKEQESQLIHQREINETNRLLFSSAIISLILLLIALGFFFYNLKLRSAHKASELEQRLLRAQMNPHFIFNTLAAIQNITLEGNSIRSSNHIAKFSKLIRQNFDYVRKEKISLDKEMAMITNYIETQQLRFNEKFDYQIKVDANIQKSAILVPPMLLQPFVENAIEYGLKHKQGKGFLKVFISKDNKHLIFTVEDNGVGRSIVARQLKVSEGLHATDIFKERLKRRGKGEEKTFKIEDLYSPDGSPMGTRVTFKLQVL